MLHALALANSEIFTIIRDIKGKELSIEELAANLQKTDLQYKIFALEQLTKRKAYSSNTIELVLKQAAIEDYSLQKLIVAYIEQAPSNVYFPSMKQLLESENQDFRILCLNSLSKTKHSAPSNFFEEISLQFSDTTSYQEINLFLTILEKRTAVSSMIVQQIMPFLESKNFIVARRVYWFLGEQNVSEAQRKKLKDFYIENAESL